MPEKRLLIVDDDALTRESLGDVLKEKGFLVTAVDKAETALELTGKQRFDVALIDIRLPDRDGVDLLRDIREVDPDLVCCIITGNASLRSAIQTLREGADDYFVKPLVLEKMLHSINAALEGRRMAAELRESEKQLRWNLEIQTVINTILHVSLTEISLDDILQHALDRILSLSWLGTLQKGAVFLLEPNAEVLVLRAGRGFSEQDRRRCARLPVGTCLCGRAVTAEEILHAECLAGRRQTCEWEAEPHGHYCVPVRMGGRPVGVLNIYLKHEHPRDSREEAFLNTVADTLAGVVQRKLIEEEKQVLESQLRQSQKMEAIGTLAGGIAHDFNNILTSILGYADLLKNEITPGTDAAEDLEYVLTAGERARDLVKQILAFSRQREQELQPVEFGIIVKEALKLLRSSLPTTIAIRQYIEPESGTVRADPTQLHQVLMNLCTNAFHAMRESGGILEVRLEKIELAADFVEKHKLLQPGPYLKLTVRDTGCGMDTRTRERIFEPYFTTKTAEEGTGLGLSVVYGIVTALNGEIVLHSIPGTGSTFEIYLPRLSRRDENAAIPREQEFRGHEHILYVDDEAPIAVLGRRMLERLGYTVTAVSDSSEALDIFRRQPDRFDAVITDQTMPGLTGFELTGRLRRIRPGLPVILVSGYSEAVTPEALAEYGIEEYLLKPLVSNEVGRAVRRALDGKPSQGI